MIVRRSIFAVSAAFALLVSATASAMVETPMALRAQAAPSVLGVGSGWVVGNGYVVTADHVVEHCHRIQLDVFDGRRVQAAIVTRDPGYDLAVLHTTLLSEVPAIPLAPFGAEPDAAVRIVGFPAGKRSLDAAPQAAVSTVRGRVITTHPDSDGFPRMAMETRLDFGSSGSVVIDAQGRAVGLAVGMLNTARYQRRSGRSAPPIGFAVPVAGILDRLPEGMRWPARLSADPLSLDEIEQRVVRVICHG